MIRSKRKEMYNPIDRYLQCLYVFIHLALLPFPLLLADVVSCSVGKGVYRCKREIDSRRLIDRPEIQYFFLITYRILRTFCGE